MRSNQFATAHNVVIDIPSHTLGRRIIAYLIDYGLFFICIWLLTSIFPTFWFEPWVRYIIVTILILLPLIQESVTGGASIGKLVMNLRVVKVDGSRARFSDYLMRWIVGIAELSTLYIIGVLTAAMSKKHQRLGDMAADTIVVTYSARTRLDDTRIDIEEEHTVEIPEVELLSSRQVSLIMRTLYRYRKSNSSPVRDRLEEISRKAANVMGYEEPEDPVAFLDQIVKDYTYIHDE